jgi:hypothetical protein
MDCLNCQALIGILHCTEVNAGKASNNLNGVGHVSIPGRYLHLLEQSQEALLSYGELSTRDKIRHNGSWYGYDILNCLLYNHRCCNPRGELPMSQQNLDSDQLHHLLCALKQDLSQSQRLNSSIRYKCQQLVTIIYSQQNQIQCLEAENGYLKSIDSDRADKLSELECLVNPFSQDGDAICNTKFIDSLEA